MDIQKCKDLSHVVKIILTFSYVQVYAERGFSINKSLVKGNLKEKTIVAKKIIHDYILANSLKAHNVEISNKLILSCSSARQKYRQYIAEAKMLTESNQRESKKQSLTHEVNSNRKECDRLKETCQVLEKDFVRLVKKGEEKRDFDFIFKTTTIKRKCEDKELEIKNLRDNITSLKAKRQKML